MGLGTSHRRLNVIWSVIVLIEQQRLVVQAILDGSKSQAERNKLGQYATPTSLARDMLQYARQLVPYTKKIKFLDPALGTGSFYSALQFVFSNEDIECATGFEIDVIYGEKARELWSNHNIDIRINDFTTSEPQTGEKVNLVIANPPYVRHHHISLQEKRRLQEEVLKRTGIILSGLSGLHCYFLLLSHKWMQENCIAGWLIPTEFMDVKYGKQIREYLLENVTLLRVHRFDAHNTQFDDALVSSAIVWFRNSLPSKGHTVQFTYGGHLNTPASSQMISIDTLKNLPKWNFQTSSPNSKGTNRLTELFSVKRGIATGANDFFILNKTQVDDYNIPSNFLKPILPSPRYLNVTKVFGDNYGNPCIDEKLFLFSSNETEENIRRKFPAVWEYLRKGIEQGVKSKYLCSNRSPWYFQEQRDPTCFLCTYMGRGDKGSPFRFILNYSNAIATNSYLMLYPKSWLTVLFDEEPKYLEVVWEELNKLTVSNMVSEGRLYGGGLHKIEPKELENVIIDKLIEKLPEEKTPKTLFSFL